jgi:hypothetical protein
MASTGRESLHRVDSGRSARGCFEGRHVAEIAGVMRARLGRQLDHRAPIGRPADLGRDVEIAGSVEDQAGAPP